MRSISNCLLSIDVDDLAIAAYNFYLGKVNPPNYSTQLKREVLFTLNLLEKLDLKATFFVNAQYCSTHDDIISKIVNKGHIIASHGFGHFDIRKMSLDQFHKDVSRSLDALTKYQPTIYGYRAPTFSMNYDREHLKILKDCGIVYVSNGPSNKECKIPTGHNIEELDFGIKHVPISSAYYLKGRLRFPIGYASIMRLSPESIYLFLLKRWLCDKNLFHFYFHPFEVAGLSSAARITLRKHLPLSRSLKNTIFRMNCGCEDVFFRLLSKFPFKPIEHFPGLLADISNVQ